jgi:hypothetical protein
MLFVSLSVWAQAPAAGPQQPHPTQQSAWDYSFIMDGYFIANDINYGSPTFTADHKWLHLEARYNYENLHTGSLWAGYNFTWGKTVELAVTPMFGAVFGRTNGFAPGCEASLTYKKLELSIANEYVVVPEDRASNFYYSWPQLTYSPTSWLRVGGVAQHTKAYHTSVDVQRGFFVGFNHKQWEVTTYVFNPGIADPTLVLEFGIHF